MTGGWLLERFQEAEERLHGALAGLGEPGRAFAAGWGLQAPPRTS